MIKLIKNTYFEEAATTANLVAFIQEASQLSFGPECLQFESAFAKWQRRKTCVFVNSGSSANLALIQALLNLGDLEKGDSVGFSALTWSTNAMPLIQLGLRPVPIDVELSTLNVSSKKLLAALKNHRVRAVFLTNLLGFCDDIDEIARICRRENILLIEDNCESLGTVYKGTLLGNFGLASTFSFYVGHHMSTIEGGAICTDDERLARMLRLVRAHGWDRNLDEEAQLSLQAEHNINSEFYSRYTFYDLGYNLRPTEIAGFLGNQQIRYLPEILKRRQQNFLTLATLYENPAYYPLEYKHIDFISNFAFPIVCKSKQLRDELVARCRNIVEIRPIVGGDMTKQPFFRKYVTQPGLENRNANLIHEQGLYFGNNPELTAPEVRTLREIFA